MTTYRIASHAGMEMGCFDGDTPGQALIASFRAAGYTEDDVWCHNSDHLIGYRDEDMRIQLGCVDDWHITEA